MHGAGGSGSDKVGGGEQVGREKSGTTATLASSRPRIRIRFPCSSLGECSTLVRLSAMEEEE